MTLRQIVRRLNAQQQNTHAGFYYAAGRAFLARARKGLLEVSHDFETFKPVPVGTVFCDHNGRPIATYRK